MTQSNLSVSSSSSKVLGWALIGFLVVGMLTLRLQTVLTCGVFHFDEAYYLLEAKTFREAADQLPQLLSGHLTLSEFKNRQMAEGNLFPPGTAKPFFSSLLIIFGLLPIPLEAAGNLLSLVAAILAGPALYIGARTLGTPKEESVLLAVLLFVSPIVTYYGDSNLPNVVAFTLFLFSLGAILKGDFMMAGLYLGLTLTTHYGTLPSVLLCLIWLMYEILESINPQKTKWLYTIRVFIIFLSPVFVFEGIYQFVKWKFSAYWKDITYRTYIEQLFRQVFANAPEGHLEFSRLHRNLHVFEGFVKTQGLVLTFIMLASLMALWLQSKSLNRRSRGFLCVATTLLLFWLLNPGYVVSRIAMFLLPGLYLTLALAINLWHRGDLRRIYLIRSALVLLILSSSFRSWHIIKARISPYPDAKNYLAQIGYQGPVIDPSNILVWQYYLGRRVDFEKGYQMNFPMLKKHAFILLNTPQAPRELPFFFKSQWAGDNYDPDLAVFLRKLSTRPPVRSWKIPYAYLALYQYDVDYAGLSNEEYLQMYWVTKKDFEGIASHG